MTREEAQEEMEIGANPNEVVDEIYDDFESRNCENCKYSNETDDGGYDFYCTKLQDYMYSIQLCNKFERKGT